MAKVSAKRGGGEPPKAGGRGGSLLRLAVTPSQNLQSQLPMPRRGAPKKKK